MFSVKGFGVADCKLKCVCTSASRPKPRFVGVQVSLEPRSVSFLFYVESRA